MYFYHVISINIHSICIKPHIKLLPNITLSQQNKKVQFLLVNQEWSVGGLKLATDKNKRTTLVAAQFESAVFGAKLAVCSKAAC